MHPVLYPFAAIAFLVLLPVLSGCVAMAIFVGYAMLLLGSSFRRSIGALGLLICYIRRKPWQT